MVSNKPKRKSRQLYSAKEYKSLYAKAKKQGLVKDKGDARSYKPTEYSRRRLRELAPYLTDEFGSVKTTPRIARQYKELFDEKASRIKVVNGRVIVPKNSSAFVALQKGYPVTVMPLTNGIYEEVILPVRWRTIDELEKAIADNPEFSAILKSGDGESFRFALGEGEPGNMASPSVDSWQDLGSMINDLLAYEGIQQASFEGEDVSGWVRIYRERQDWKFPEYRREMDRRKLQRARDAQKKARDRKAARESQLPEAERERIAQRRRDKRLDSRAYERQLEKAKEKRKADTSDNEARKARDAARKKKARDARRKAGLSREPR